MSLGPLRQLEIFTPLHEPLHWRAKRDPKANMLSLQSLLRNGVSLAYVGRNYNLKDLKDTLMLGCLTVRLRVGPHEVGANAYCLQRSALDMTDVGTLGKISQQHNCLLPPFDGSQLC